MAVRRATPADETALSALDGEDLAAMLAAAGHPAELAASLAASQRAGRRATYTANYPDNTEFVAVVDGQVVGRLWLGRAPHGFAVLDLTVARAHRGRGHGADLLRAACAEADTVALDLRALVRRDNAPSLRLLAAQGFTVAEGAADADEVVLVRRAQVGSARVPVPVDTLRRMETTLVLLKPDAVRRGLMAEIIGRFERRGLRFRGMQLMQLDRATAERHYAEHAAKPFFGELVDFLSSGPLVALALEGESAVKLVRDMMGATHPASSAPGTIRGDLATELAENVVHGSDSTASAERELALFFPHGLL